MNWSGLWRQIYFRPKEQAEYLEILLHMMEDDLSALDACEQIEQFGSGTQRKIAHKMMQRLCGGYSLAESADGLFDPIVTNALFASEVTSNRLEGLRVAVNTLQQSLNIWGSLAGAVLKPLGSLAMLAVMYAIVYRSINSLFGHGSRGLADGGGLSAMVYATGALFWNHWFLIVCLLALLVVGVVWSMPAMIMGRRFINLLPVYRHYGLAVSAKMLNLFAALWSNNISPKEVVQILKASGSPYERWQLENVERLLDTGERNIGVVFGELAIPAMEINKMQILMSRTSNPVRVLEQSARATTKTLDRQVKRMAFKMELICKSLFMVCLLALIGGIALWAINSGVSF
ncbi:hypothetical protein [Dongshaea marina]|uniref:hypothetical protein n=1 Tax=Dongshaea marina TaxID=2047966 RepID=UPI000D3E5C90|nr:hypothetical protein [Dongshaea marina]